MKWRAAKVGERVYDLSHLHPFSFDFVVVAKDGNPEQRYGIDVIFSLHCFSRGIAEGTAYLADLAYADSREVRLFDEQRYRHSLRLPEVIRSIGDRRCFHTGHDNFFTVELIDAEGERVEYTVYFKLSRAPGICSKRLCARRCPTEATEAEEADSILRDRLQRSRR